MSILALGRKHKEKENSQSKKGRRHKKKRKFPNQEREETQKRKKIPNKRVGEKKRIPIKEWEKAKKKESSRSKIGRKQKKYAERSLDQTISEQYRIVTK